MKDAGTGPIALVRVLERDAEKWDAARGFSGAIKFMQTAMTGVESRSQTGALELAYRLSRPTRS